MAIILDAAAYLRIDAPQTFGTSASGASFATSTGDIFEVACFGPGIFRLRLGPNTRPDYGILTGRAKACTVARNADGAWTFASGDALLEITGTPLRCRLLWKGMPILNSTEDELPGGGSRLPAFGRLRAGNQWTAAFALASGDRVFGMGESFGPLDKRGQLLHSQVDDAQGVNTALMYRSTPFAWSAGSEHGTWGAFVHTPGKVSHGVGHPEWSHRSYAVVVEDEALDIFLLAGASPTDVLLHYTALTGRPAGVPDWSLGVWVESERYGSAARAAKVAGQLRARKIPCDVMMLDGHTLWGGNHCFDFGFDAEAMPDPKAALAPIAAHHLRIGARTTPCVGVGSPAFPELAGRGQLLTQADGAPYVVQAALSTTHGGPAGLVDFTHPAAFNLWRDAHELLFESGISVLRTDGGEHVPDDALAYNGDQGLRLHNAYPLLYNRCVFEATSKFQPRADGPPFLWARSGWAGSQRFPLGFGGDPQSDWEGLAAALRGALSDGMSGSPFHGTLVGGTYGAGATTPELFVRWLQAAVFGSHLSVHARGEREPWAYGGEAEAVARKWLGFRYRLLPYLARVAQAAVATGLPVARAMPLVFPHNSLLRGFETQFMCGDALLVAPIIQPGGVVDIALPPGAWYDLNTRQRYAGKQVLRYMAPLDQFPVFGREGHVLPLGRAVMHTGEIDAAAPLDMLWVFGAPTHALEGFAQASMHGDDTGHWHVQVDANVSVQVFGDAAAATVETRASAQ